VAVRQNTDAMKRAAFAAAALLAVACGSNTNATPPIQRQPPTANLKPLDKVGPGEGQLNLIALEGYVDDLWAKPFTQTTGCQIQTHYAGSSDEMVNLMKDGGAGQWDMVSASGDADLQLIYGGDVRPMNETLIPDWRNFQEYFKTPPYNTISGIHYGISLQWSPNVLLYNTNKFKIPPTSWSAVYDSSNKGLITAYDSPMTIADAALYLSKTEPKLGIKDPYELTKAQFDATVTLLMQQRQLIKRYWPSASIEIDMFQNGDTFVGAAWPYQTSQLKLAGAPVAETIPSEGATGWGDTWMLATKAPHPNCAYLWTQYVSTAKVQAEQAITFGESPVNSKACAEMEAQSPGSCAQYHAAEPPSYLDNIKFWKTPTTTCADGSQSCIPYDQWVSAWATIKG
jgi:putative spermidine/putrescine transport system substrate-binding protein